jgi:kinesin family protein 11
LADTVASTSERGVADFMSKHAADLTSIRERFTTDLSTAIRADAPTGTTPARESARALLAEPVTPSAFRFHRDDVLRRRPTVDGKPPPSSASRPPLSPIN